MSIGSTPAFPQDADVHKTATWFHGMTLRQWYIGQALAGLAGDPTIAEQVNKARQAGVVGITSLAHATVMARMAIEIADALIVELDRKG